MREKIEAREGWTTRRGFTLVELLIVLAILGLLMSLTAGAAILVMGYQRQSNTETTIRTLYTALDHQWKAVVEAADRETIPSSVVTMATAGNFNDAKRAKVIWKKLRLRQAFPMNYTEALYPWYVPIVGAPLSFSDLPPLKTFGTSKQDPYHTIDWPTIGALRTAGIYVPATNELQTGNLIYPASVNTATTQYWPATSGQYLPASCWEAESSACLLISLNAGQSGASRLTNEQLPPSSLAALGPNLNLVVDAWGFPIVFYRWPAGDFFSNYPTGSSDVDSVNPAGATQQFRDPLDPDGILMDPAWNNQANFSGQAGVFWFEQYCHPVHVMDPALGYKQVSLYMIPVIASAGKNNRLGLAQPAAQGSPFLPDLMTPDPLDLEGALDNVNSYRLR
jgi:prepilin-type N-terminal cleavage/methylation domain-containing protein